MKTLYILLALLISSSLQAKESTIKYYEMLTQISLDLCQDLEKVGISRLAIVNVVDEDGNSCRLGSMIEQDLAIEVLSCSNGIEIMDRKHLTMVLQEHHLALGGLMNEESLFSLGKLEAVDAILTGTISYHSGEFTLFTKILKTESGMIVSARKAFFDSKSIYQKAYKEKIKTTDLIYNSEAKTRGILILENNFASRISVRVYHTDIENKEQRDFSRIYTLKRGEQVRVEEVPIGNVNVYAEKVKRNQSMTSYLMSMFKPVKSSFQSIVVKGGTELEVVID